MYVNYDRLISFLSIHHAMRAEKVLQQAGCSVLQVPTPREVTISCGQCLLFSKADQNSILEVLAREGIAWSKLFSRNSLDRVYEKIKEYEG